MDAFLDGVAEALDGVLEDVVGAFVFVRGVKAAAGGGRASSVVVVCWVGAAAIFKCLCV